MHTDADAPPDLFVLSYNLAVTFLQLSQLALLSEHSSQGSSDSQHVYILEILGEFFFFNEANLCLRPHLDQLQENCIMECAQTVVNF